jgi:filamentous hemagglutinin
LGENSRKSSKRVDGETVFVANTDVDQHIRKGDQFYLDKKHGNHIEVYDSNNKARAVLNLDGSLNAAKTAAALKQGRTIPK